MIPLKLVIGFIVYCLCFVHISWSVVVLTNLGLGQVPSQPQPASSLAASLPLPQQPPPQPLPLQQQQQQQQQPHLALSAQSSSSPLLSSGQPQRPVDSNTPAVHVRVTSGRQGGRFFYRVSEMNIPNDLYTVILPMNYFYRFLPYPMLPAESALSPSGPSLPSSFPTAPSSSFPFSHPSSLFNLTAVSTTEVPGSQHRD